MVEVESTYLRAATARVSAVDVRPIEWLEVDSPAPRITPLQAQLAYFARMFDSAEAGTLLARLPASSHPGRS